MEFEYPCALNIIVKDPKEWARLSGMNPQTWKEAGIRLNPSDFNNLTTEDLKNIAIKQFACSGQHLTALVKSIANFLEDGGIVYASRSNAFFDVKTPQVDFWFGDAFRTLKYPDRVKESYAMAHMCYHVRIEDVQKYVNYIYWNGAYAFSEKERNVLADYGIAPQEYTGDEYLIRGGDYSNE